VRVTSPAPPPRDPFTPLPPAPSPLAPATT